MRKNKKEHKRIVAAILAVMLIIVMIFSLAAPFVLRAESVGPAQDIGAKPESGAGPDVFWESGMGGRYRLGAPFPVKVELRDKGAGFKGAGRIRVTKSEEVPQYYGFPVDLPAGAYMSDTIHLLIYENMTSISLEILDSAGKILSSHPIPVKAAAPESVLGGVITGNFSGLSDLRTMKFFDKLSGQEQMLGDGLIWMNRSALPITYEFLRNFNFIIVDSFSLTQLQPSEVSAIEGYILEGGIAFLSGAGALKEVSAAFTPGFMELVPGEDLGGFAGIQWAGGALSADWGLELQSAYYHGGTPRAFGKTQEGEGEAAVISSFQKEKGVVIVSGFDLGASPVAGDENAVSVINAILSEEAYLPGGSQVLSEIDPYYGGYRNQMLESSMQNTGSFWITGVIFLICGAFAGAVCFMIPRLAHGKAGRAYFLMAGASLAAAASLLALGASSSYKKPFANRVSFIRLNGQNTTFSKNQIYLFASQAGNIEAYFNKNIPVFPVEETEGITNSLKIGFSGRYNNQGAWMSLGFAAFDKPYVPAKLQSYVTYQNGKFTGSITNSTDISFSELWAGVKNNYRLYENFEPGDTIDIDLPVDFSLYYSEGSGIGSYYDSNSYEGYGFRPSKQEGLDDLKAYAGYLLDGSNEYYYSDSTFHQLSAGAGPVFEIHGFTEQGNMGDVESFGVKAITRDLYCYSATVEISYQEGEKISLPYGFIKPFRVTGSGKFSIDGELSASFRDMGEFNLEGDGALTISYRVPEYMDISGFCFDAQSLTASAKHNKEGRKVEIFNWVTGEWEPLDYGAYDGSGGGLEAGAYVNNYNTVILRSLVLPGQYFNLPVMEANGIKRPEVSYD